MTGSDEPAVRARLPEEAPVSARLPDEATGLEEFLEELMELDGVLMAALLDRSGRVISGYGFEPGLVEDVAVLAAGIHANGARLGEVAGDRGFPRTLIRAGDRSILITPLPVRAGIPLVLIVVATGISMGDLGPRLEEVSGVSLEEVSALNSVDDPETFEASLLECLDGLFPREARS